jgi:dipeptidase E
MKTLILASSGQFITNNNIDKYLPKKLVDCKIAYIITASKKVSDSSYINKHRQKMSQLNFNYTEIDIDGKNENELKKILDGYEVILMEGGNTFYLLKSIRESGFEKVIKNLIKKEVVYIGSSAGSYVACPSIIMATFSERPKDRCGVDDFTALNLVPFLISAHYTPDKLPNLKEKSKILNLPLHILNDQQAIISIDGKTKLLGDGEKIIL